MKKYGSKNGTAKVMGAKAYTKPAAGKKTMAKKTTARRK